MQEISIRDTYHKERAVLLVDGPVQLKKTRDVTVSIRPRDGALGKIRPVYVELFHGRKSIDDDMEDWGESGPIFGPMNYAHTTYKSELKLGPGPDGDGDGLGYLQVVEDCMYYDGMYYGDWSVFSDLQLNQESRIVAFEQDKATLPEADQRRNRHVAKVSAGTPRLEFYPDRKAGCGLRLGQMIFVLKEALTQLETEGIEARADGPQIIKDGEGNTIGMFYYPFDRGATIDDDTAGPADSDDVGDDFEPGPGNAPAVPVQP